MSVIYVWSCIVISKSDFKSTKLAQHTFLILHVRHLVVGIHTLFLSSSLQHQLLRDFLEKK